MSAQQKEIKRLYEHINDMKKKGTHSSRIGTTSGGGLAGNVCPHCALAAQILAHTAYSVLENEAGKLINYGQI